MENFKNKLGTIEIPKQLIEQANKNFFKALFSDFYPIAIKEHAGSFFYLCISKFFEEKKEKDQIPRYSLTFTTTKSGKIKLKRCEKI